MSWSRGRKIKDLLLEPGNCPKCKQHMSRELKHHLNEERKRKIAEGIRKMWAEKKGLV